MKVLYAGTLSSGNSAAYRMWALERLGLTCIPFETEAYESGSRLLRKIEFRLSAGSNVTRMNRDLLELARREKPDVFWSDKLLKLRPETLGAMRAMGIVTVSYMIDNAFGPRRDPGWRLYYKDIPHFDLHVTQRDISVQDYRERGARDVIKIQTAYEPTIHFPPPAGWSDEDRDREVSFVGTPYDNRAGILARLAEEGVPVSVSGRHSAWVKALSKASMEKIFYSDLLYEDKYREAIWKSKINLSFLTRANLDEYTHKSFEIAGCGGFLLVERCPGHLLKFVEDEEAVFFGGFDELKAKIERWLPDEAGRLRIAAAGRERAVRDGYHNDRQVQRIIERVQQIRSVLPARR
jgi:spore maturation protein CgeB